MQLWFFLLLVHRVQSKSLQKCLDYIWSSVAPENCYYVYENGYDVELPLHNSSCYVEMLNGVVKIRERRVDLILLSFATWQGFINSLWRAGLKTDGRIVLLSHNRANSVDLLLQMLLNFRLYNVLVVEDLKVYTHKPITKGRCMVSKTVYLGYCGGFKIPQQESIVEYFHNCSATVKSTTRSPFVNDDNSGLEISILILLSKRLEFVPEFRDDLQLYDVQVGGIGLFSLDNYYDKVYYQSQDEVAFFRKVFLPREPWKTALLIFDWENWGLLLASLLVLSGVFWVRKVGGSLDGSAIFVLSILIMCAHKAPPRLTPLFILWSFTAFILASSYKSFLVSFMFKTVLDTQASSAESMLQLGYTFGAAPVLESIFNHSFTTRVSYMECPYNSIKCFKRLEAGKFALLTTVRTISDHMRRQGYNKVTKLETLWKGYIAFPVLIYSPLLRRLKEVLLRMDESGLVNVMEVEKIAFSVSVPNKFDVISLRHLYFIFYFYVICTVLSGVAFSIELMIGRHR